MSEKSCIALDELIDSRSRDLFDFVSQNVTLSICYGKGENYGVYQCGGEAVIYIPKNRYSPASFAHELLHLLLSIYGVNVGGAIKLQKTESPYLSLVVSDELADCITNVLEHRKMFPWYIALGYDRMEFLSDAARPVLTDNEVDCLQRMFNTKGSINHDVVDCFIGKYIVAKGACIDVFDYSLQLSNMYKIAPKLCKIIDFLVSRWDKYDETMEEDISTESYICIVYDFLNGIEQWIRCHGIC